MTIVAEKCTLLRGGSTRPTGTLVLRHVMRVQGGAVRMSDLAFTEAQLKDAEAAGGLQAFVDRMRKGARLVLAVQAIGDEAAEMADEEMRGPDPDLLAPCVVVDRRDLITGPDLLEWQLP